MKRIVSNILVLPLLLHTAFGCAFHQDHAGHQEHVGHREHSGRIGHSGHGSHASLCVHSELDSAATSGASHEFGSDKRNGINRCTGHVCEVQQAISQGQFHPGNKQPCNGLCTYCTFPTGLPHLVLRDLGSNGNFVGSLPKSLCAIEAATIDTVRMDCARNPFAEIAQARVHLLLGVFLI
jgi:hypothetical protein